MVGELESEGRQKAGRAGGAEDRPDADPAQWTRACQGKGRADAAKARRIKGPGDVLQAITS